MRSAPANDRQEEYAVAGTTIFLGGLHFGRHIAELPFCGTFIGVISQPHSVSPCSYLPSIGSPRSCQVRHRVDCGSGGTGRTRTGNHGLTRRSLYLLSYCSIYAQRNFTGHPAEPGELLLRAAAYHTRKERLHPANARRVVDPAGLEPAAMRLLPHILPTELRIRMARPGGRVDIGLLCN